MLDPLKKIIILLFVVMFSWTPFIADAQEYIQLSGVMHVHSIFSSGKYSIEKLASLAAENDIDVLVLTDHDLVTMEYGVRPFRNIFKKREERDSVIKNGPENFLGEIARVNQGQNKVIIVPGVQSSPFYYWTGNHFKEGVTGHNYRKELLVIGMTDPEDYKGLPLLHNGYSTRFTKNLLPRFLIAFVAFFLSVYLFFKKGFIRKAGGIMTILSIVLMIDQHPFKSSRFDQYHGDKGISPYQDLIDYAREKDGLVFWAHPESRYSINGRKLGPVTLMTKKYPEVLFESKNYTGFSAIYGDNISVTKPGNDWDLVLNDYCSGIRSTPTWGISGSDFHPREPGEKLDMFQTVFLVKENSVNAVLEALAKGRFYAVRKRKGPRLSLDMFQVSESIKYKKTRMSAIMGEGILPKGQPIVEGGISASDGSKHNIVVSLIRGGKVLETFKGNTPMEFHYLDKDIRPGKTYYRLEVTGKTTGKLLSNPIFIRTS